MITILFGKVTTDQKPEGIKQKENESGFFLHRSPSKANRDRNTYKNQASPYQKPLPTFGTPHHPFSESRNPWMHGTGFSLASELQPSEYMRTKGMENSLNLCPSDPGEPLRKIVY